MVQPSFQGALQEALIRAFRQLTVTFANRAAHDPRAIGRSEFALLTILDRRGPLRPSAVAAVEGYDLSTISRQLAGLESRGRVARQADPADGRAHLVSITDEGRRVLTAERSARADLVASALHRWSDADLATLTTLLERLTDDIAATRPGACPAATERTSA